MHERAAAHMTVHGHAYCTLGLKRRCKCEKGEQTEFGEKKGKRRNNKCERCETSKSRPPGTQSQTKRPRKSRHKDISIFRGGVMTGS